MQVKRVISGQDSWTGISAFSPEYIFKKAQHTLGGNWGQTEQGCVRRGTYDVSWLKKLPAACYPGETCTCGITTHAPTPRWNASYVKLVWQSEMWGVPRAGSWRHGRHVTVVCTVGRRNSWYSLQNCREVHPSLSALSGKVSTNNQLWAPFKAFCVRGRVGIGRVMEGKGCVFEQLDEPTFICIQDIEGYRNTKYLLNMMSRVNSW